MYQCYSLLYVYSLLLDLYDTLSCSVCNLKNLLTLLQSYKVMFVDNPISPSFTRRIAASLVNFLAKRKHGTGFESALHHSVRDSDS